jgi:A/G-specific adenine glycosylase
VTRRAQRQLTRQTRADTAPNDLLTRTETSALQRALLRWFAVARRSLPWRSKRDPYSTWVSEVMLQQTQVATVVPYFERWMRTYPTVSALAESGEQDVLKLWEGLGYYSRARSLRAGARVVCEKFAGQVPSDLADLRSIPGIGRYTAGAIASIGHDKPAAILDGNVMRVLCRLRDLEGDPRKGSLNELLWTLAEQLVTDTNPCQLNESLMELGATVCTPTRPRCTECPLRSRCKALANATVELRPSPIRRTAPTDHRVLIAIVSLNSRILVEQQPAQAPRWAGLWTFPNWQCADFDNPEKSVAQWLQRELALATSPRRATRPEAARSKRPPASPPDAPGIVLRGKYSITRFRFSFIAVQALVPRAAQLRMANLPDHYAWVTREQLLQLPMPAPHRRVARAIP